MEMKSYLIIDDEMNSAMDLKEVLSMVEPESFIQICNETDQALDYLKEVKGTLRAIFLDIQLRGMLGLDLYHQLKEIDPEVPIVFVTAYDQYAIQGWKIHAAGYLLKPADPGDIKDILSVIEKNYSVRQPEEKEKPFKVECFGNFEIFFKGKPLVFKRNRSKEVLAYLIDRRGQLANSDEICDALWEDSFEDKKNKNYFRQLFFDIQHTFKECEAEEALIHRRNQYAVDESFFDCDYYRYMDKEEGTEELFQGEYMSQYSWAEVRLGYLLFNED